MNNIEITKFKSLNDTELYRLSLDENRNEIYIKLNDILLPFDCQKYNNNYYINAETLCDKKTEIIELFESIVKNKLKINDNQFVSIIKPRQQSKHIKLMLKKHKKNLILDVKSADNDENTENSFDIFKLSEYHKMHVTYDIIVKPEILWNKNDTYGITFYLVKIIIK